MSRRRSRSTVPTAPSASSDRASSSGGPRFGARFFGQGLGACPERGGDPITLEPLRPRTFDKDSPVTAYWLTRCDGFQVVGGRRPTTVEGTVVDDDPLQPVALRVRRGPRSGGLIPIELVEGVCPMERILYVRRPPSRASRAAAGVSALAPHGRRAARSTALSCVAAWRFGAPRAGASARASARAGRRQWPWIRRGIVAFAHGAIVFSLVTATLVAAGLIIAARIARYAWSEARLLVPYGVRAAGEFVAGVRRVLLPPTPAVWSVRQRDERLDLDGTHATPILAPELGDGVREVGDDGRLVTEARRGRRPL
jgi:hypothetical protein